MKTETSHILCYTVLCACFLVLSCKRINDDSSEYRNSFIGEIVEDDVWGFIETFITEHADSIIFYSDASCTTREPLPFKRRIKVLRTECTDNNLNYHYDYSYLTVTVPAGTTAYCLWQGFNYECYYCSDPYNYHITTHEIVNKQLNSISYIHQ